MKEDILQSHLKDVELYGDFKSHKAEIDAEDLSWILQILSTNLYSDPIGSLIREYSSNAWDANVEAGNKDKPIEVGLQTSKDQGTYWYVTDLGPGLSPERIDGVYRKFGKSTKRDSNEAIGMMGLGKFSGLSYSNEIYITTRVDGREYEYLMHKSEGAPQIDLLIDKPTDKPNGTTIKVFLSNGYGDKREFKNKILEQLAYFENVYYNIDDMPDLNQKIKLVKGKTFTYSNQESRDLRIKLGPVTYPIDANVIKSVNSSFFYLYRGLALNFEIGELAITPNRESILYNKKTIEVVEKRIEEFRHELVELYNTKGAEYENVKAFVEALNNFKITVGDSSYTVPTNITSLVTPKLKGLNDIEFRANYTSALFPNYSVNADYNGNRRSKEYNHSLYPEELTERGMPTLLSDTIAVDPKKMKYIYEQNVSQNKVGQSMKIIKRHNKIKLKNFLSYNNNLDKNCYYYLLSLDKVHKSKWREIIKKFQDWERAYVESKVIDYNKVNVPKAWLDAQKTASINSNVVALRKANGKILMYYAEKSSRWGGVASFNGKDVLISQLEKQHNFIIYAEELFKDELKKAYAMLYNYSGIKVVVTAEKNHKYLKLFPNYMHVTEFLKGNNKYFRKCVGAYVLRTMYGHNDQFYYSKDLLQYLNKDTYDKFIELHKESNKLESNYERNVHASNNDKFEYREFMNKALAEGKVDYGYLDKANRLKAIQDKFEFITLVKPNGTYSYYYDNAQKDFAVWVAKKKQVKLSLTHYLKQQENDTTGSEGTDDSEDSTID